MKNPTEHLCADERTISKMLNNLPSEKDLSRICDILGAMNSGTRLKTLYLLLEGEMCVRELAMALQVSQPTISHSLRTLRQLDLVRVRKEGRFAVYYLADEHVSTFLEMFRQHAGEYK
ncbi:MAG: helix-turn-helix transcriptional regulator [Methanosarcinaceae archaeon]|nr:helix-turn-helix transcriptional regulator [Methanosarcinaceae archaeon]